MHVYVPICIRCALIIVTLLNKKKEKGKKREIKYESPINFLILTHAYSGDYIIHKHTFVYVCSKLHVDLLTYI